MTDMDELNELHRDVVSEQEAKSTATALNRFKDFLLRAFDISVRSIISALQKTELKVKGKVDVTFPQIQKTSDEKAHEKLATLLQQYSELAKGLQSVSQEISRIKLPNIPEVKFPSVQRVSVQNWEHPKPPIVNVPDKVTVANQISVEKLQKTMNGVVKLLETINKEGLKAFVAGRDEPERAMAVQLSDGKEFYKVSSRIFGGPRVPGVLADENFEVRFENDENGNTIYVGRSAPGTSEDAERWKIKKLEYDENGNLSDVKWAGGTTEFKHSWANRANYDY